MHDMKFSILIPAYKSRFIKKTIESILSQTYSNFEIIIVDDASPEDIHSIVNAFNDSRIRYYRNEKNCGAVNVVNNWNICLSYAKGDYVICMGDDDMLTSEALAEYDRLSTKYPQVNLLHSRVMIINENDKPTSVTLERAEYETLLSFVLQRMQGRIQFIGDFCFKTSALREVGGFFFLPLAWASDDISTFSCAKNGVANTNMPTFLYRSSQYTITRTGNIEIKLNAIMQEKQWYKDFIGNVKASTTIDKLILKEIRENLDKSFIKKRARTIGEDIRWHWTHLFKWMIMAKKYDLKLSVIALAIIEAWKHRLH